MSFVFLDPIKEISNVFDWAKFRRAIKIKRKSITKCLFELVIFILEGCRLENHVPLDQLNKRFVEIDGKFR